jgi:hypothetical protein
MYELVRAFFVSLFELSFKEFITAQVIKILYVLAIIAAGIFSLSQFFRGFHYGPLGAFFMLLAGVVWFVVLVMGARVALELVMVVFRIAENTTVLARKERTDTPVTKVEMPTMRMEPHESDIEPQTVIVEPTVTEDKPEDS